MSQIRRVFFSRTVTMPAATAVLLSTLMTAAGWAETDSHEGVQGILAPQDEALYIGDDEDVRDAAGVGTYQGVTIGAGDSANLANYRNSAGLVDPNTIWLYSAGAGDVGVIFNGL